MRLGLLRIACAAGIGLAGGGSIIAHHAFSAEFDGNRPVKLRGTVIKMEWINPHSWLTIEVKGPDSKIATWEIEAGAPNAMFRRGFRKDSLPPGTEVTVEGFQAKSGKNMANGRNLTLSNGQKLFMGSSGTGAPGPEPK